MDFDNNRLIMIGTISAIYPEDATARVMFSDRDSMVSKRLPVMFTRALGIEIYAMPNVGEEVLCIFLANGLEEGFIVGAYYNDINKPPAKDKNIKIIKFEDGNYIKYEKGTFTIKGNVVVEGEIKSNKFIGDLVGDVDGLCKGAH